MVEKVETVKESNEAKEEEGTVDLKEDAEGAGDEEVDLEDEILVFKE